MGRVASALDAEQLPQGQRIPNGKAFPIVVEIDVHALPHAAQGLHLCRPRLQLLPGETASRLATPMHAEVGECRGGDPVGVEPAAYRDAQRYLVCCQQLVDLGRMPAGMAELDHPALAGREQGEKGCETGEVELLGGRKLEQDRAQFGAQMASAAP